MRNGRLQISPSPTARDSKSAQFGPSSARAVPRWLQPCSCPCTIAISDARVLFFACRRQSAVWKHRNLLRIPTLRETSETPTRNLGRNIQACAPVVAPLHSFPKRGAITRYLVPRWWHSCNALAEIFAYCVRLEIVCAIPAR
jgi:hypothetical protein